MLGLLNASGGLAGAAISLFMPTFLDNFGWRSGYLLIAALFALLTVPNALFLLVEHPESIGLNAYGSSAFTAEDGLEPAREQSISYQTAKRTKQFYILFIGTLLSSFSVGLLQHLPAHFSGMGFSAPEVGTLFSILMAGVIIANISIGVVNDRFDSSITILLVSACMIVALFLLATTHAFLALSILMLILAFGVSGPGLLTPLVVGETFGPADYPRIWSIMGMAPSIGLSISGPLWGVIYDVTGSYKIGMYGTILLTIIYCGCHIFTLKNPPLKNVSSRCEA